MKQLFLLIRGKYLALKYFGLSFFDISLSLYPNIRVKGKKWETLRVEFDKLGKKRK